MEERVFNEHDKKEYPPMHTVEHLINGSMTRLFGTERSVSAHVEKKKSRMDFVVNFLPTDEDALRLEADINRILREDIPVTFEVMTQEKARGEGVDLGRIPNHASDMVRIAIIGAYDKCLCIGTHVRSTAECGKMILYSHDYNPDNKRWRIRFKLENEAEQYKEF